GTLEVLGPYSRPSGWIISKFIFTFGGLFFPVILFPPILEQVARFTPFPSVIFVPGSFLLGLPVSRVLVGVAEQALWLTVMLLAAILAERFMLRRVLEKGE
ncbi:MAG: hypothetical protein JNM63_09665, partial [Spirochaetia bacterium]|nr:hypothetical protein [Spirochaetia bacterium]